jgi:aminomethyltransferase
MMAKPMKQTPLNEAHRAMGARMTEFGGFEMPLSYSGIIDEHLAVRSAAGVFDLSHMGEFEIGGPDALGLLENALTNSAAKLTEGQAQYTLMCAEDGGAIDDLIVYRLAAERYMLCVNASNIAADREWLRGLARGRVDFRDISDETALIAVQGPRSLEILGKLAKAPIESIGRFRIADAEVAGVRSLIARTGYTGEDGFELFVAADGARTLFDAILEAGAGAGLKPCGLGARDTLRMEAGLPLYGHELDRATTPLEAGLATFVKFGRGFVGERAIAAKRDGGGSKILTGVRTEDGRSIARQGYAILRAGRRIGLITSGTFAPSFNRPLAMGYLDPPGVRAGDLVEVEIRSRAAPATVVTLPFYRRERTHPHS